MNKWMASPTLSIGVADKDGMRVGASEVLKQGELSRVDVLTVYKAV
jgi:hypothetical protein